MSSKDEMIAVSNLIQIEEQSNAVENESGDEEEKGEEDQREGERILCLFCEMLSFSTTKSQIRLQQQNRYGSSSRLEVGFTFIDFSSGTIEVGSDFDNSPMFPFVSYLLFQMHPTTILISNRTLLSLVELLKHSNREKNPNVITLQMSDFSSELAKERLISMLIGERCKDSNELNLEQFTNLKQREMIEQIIEISTQEILKAIGGLVSFLTRKASVEGAIWTPQITSFLKISHDDFMKIDEDTLNSIGIFHEEKHPVINSSGKPKEGLSLLGLFYNHAKTQAGKSLLKMWLIRPSRSLTVINNRLDSIEQLCKPELTEFVQEIGRLLATLSGLSKVAKSFKVSWGSSTNFRDWIKLFDGLESAKKLQQLFNETLTCNLEEQERAGQQRSVIPTGLCRIWNAIFKSDGISKASSLISNVFDFEEMKKAKKVIVKRGVDSNLDKLRHVKESLGGILDLLAKTELENLEMSCGGWIKKLHAIYSPQIGFLLAIPIVKGDEQQMGLVSPYYFDSEKLSKWLKTFDLDFQFKTEKGIYLKSKGCIQADNKIGDISSSVSDAEAKIISKVAERIVGFSDELLELGDSSSEIDALRSIAICCKENNWVRPTFISSEDESSLITITNSRHPILEVVIDNFIQNDFKQRTSDSKTIILTGANSSGKTVFASQIALICIMAQIGCFVPASYCCVPLFDMVFCQLGKTSESSLDSFSSFAKECNRVGEAISQMTSRSLIILDEFGKGTSVEDGISLFSAFVQFFSVNEIHRKPRLSIFVTHFTDSLEYLRNEIIGIDSFDKNIVTLQMQYIQHLKQQREVVFLFKIADGISHDSLCFECARIAGIPEEVVKRAESVCNLLKLGKPVYPLQQQNHESEGNQEDEQRAIEIAKMFLSIDINDEQSLNQFLTELLNAKES